MTTGTDTPPAYDCGICPGYCCSYDEILLSDADVTRLCAQLGLSVDDLIRRYTKYGMYHGSARYPLMMKHKPDPHFRTICIFFDSDARRCGIYEARPETCRNYPHGAVCGYFEFLRFERQLQGDADHVATT